MFGGIFLLNFIVEKERKFNVEIFSLLGEYCREFPYENLGILLDLFAVYP